MVFDWWDERGNENGGRHAYSVAHSVFTVANALIRDLHE